MDDNIINCRNRLKTDLQFTFCEVKITDDNIEKINKIAAFMDAKKVTRDIDKVKEYDVLYFILGGGVKCAISRSDINPSFIEEDIDMVLYRINQCSKYTKE